jgi:hypothetical protein
VCSGVGVWVLSSVLQLRSSAARPLFQPSMSFIPLFLFLVHFSLSFLPSSTGDVGNLVLPVGMQNVNFEFCRGLTGTLATMPPSMKTFDFTNTGVKIDVAAIEWPANATALAHEDDALVCHTTDPDESEEGAETSEIRIKCEPDQVIGTSLGCVEE